MSLRPLRQQEQVDINFIAFQTQERGGILSFAVASGIQYLEYAASPSGAIPLGIQLNDIEHIDFSREPSPQRIRNTDVPCSIVGVGVQGDFETDWIYPIGTIFNGDKAYVGPSGTFTNSPVLGGKVVGRFLGPLKPDVHPVVFRGLGFSRQYVDCFTKKIVWDNNPADMITIVSPGFIKIRVDNSAMMRDL